MGIRVLLFASYADAYGADSMVVELPTPSRVDEVLRAVQAGVRGRVPPHPLVAVNAVYALADQLVKEGDEVAIIPPVAGG